MSQPTEPAESTEAAARPLPPRAFRVTDFLLGMVPVLGALALVGVLKWASLQPLTPHYQQRAKELLEQRKFDAALACLKRLVALNPERLDLRFLLGLTYDSLGQRDTAATLMRDLAPLEEKGYVPAQVWLAEKLMPTASTRPEHAREAERRLQIALVEYPKSAVVLRDLGTLYSSIGQPKKAIPYLVPISENQPAVLLALGTCCASIGDHESAAVYRRQAVEAAQRSSKGKPDSAEARLLWCQALAASGDFKRAYEVLEEPGLRVDARVLDPAKGALCAEWGTKIWPGSRAPTAAATPGQAAECLRVTILGLGFDPHHELLINLLSSMIRLPGPAGEAARGQARALIETKKPPAAAAHLALANDALMRGDADEALRNLEAGYAIDPASPILANNYAWSLAHLGKTDPARALTVIDGALKRLANDPRLHGTRGLILYRLGRLHDADVELSRALAAGNTHVEVRNTLASLRRSPLGRETASGTDRR